MRDIESGKDVPVKITIYNAKLQSNLNLSMAPNGDPSTFTFTFDAFPVEVDGEKGVIYDFNYNMNDEESGAETTVTIHSGENVYVATMTAATPTITISTTGAITCSTGAVWTKDGESSSAPTLGTDTLVNMLTFSQYEKDTTATTITLDAGSHTTWYII